MLVNTIINTTTINLLTHIFLKLGPYLKYDKNNYDLMGEALIRVFDDYTTTDALITFRGPKFELFSEKRWVSISNFQKEFIQQNSVPFAALVNQERKAPIFITITKRTNSTSNVVQAALSRPSTRNLQEVLINHGNCYIDFGTVKCLDKVKHNTTIKIKLTYITFQHGILSEKEYSTEFEDWSTKIKNISVHVDGNNATFADAENTNCSIFNEHKLQVREESCCELRITKKGAEKITWIKNDTFNFTNWYNLPYILIRLQKWDSFNFTDNKRPIAVLVRLKTAKKNNKGFLEDKYKEGCAKPLETFNITFKMSLTIMALTYFVFSVLISVTLRAILAERKILRQNPFEKDPVEKPTVKKKEAEPVVEPTLIKKKA